MRALAWSGDTLYASRGYELRSAEIIDERIVWRYVASYRPAWWRHLTSRNRLTFRLVRDGFHALAILPGGTLVGALPGAIAILPRGETEFVTTHRMKRGTRPLHLTAVPDGHVYWGEYFDNSKRDEVYIYGSIDHGAKWEVAYTFPSRSIRHVHNIVYDKWSDCLWIFTGDYGQECRILRASVDFRIVDEVGAGNQQTRAVAALATEEGLYFASDTPLEQNHIYRLDRRGIIRRLSALPSSSIYAGRNRNGMFFSTMIEPSAVNSTQNVTIYGSSDGDTWDPLGQWVKDRWPMSFFQYGNAFLPDGENTSEFLAATTIAVQNEDIQLAIWWTKFDSRP
jgi:hypothetical protein